ncbi:MAG: hypothetical protein MUC57_04990, partial [Desulfobacterales bacterium]|nr:hypothetical protein [Desulfobacterales bacterium]
ERGTGFQEVLPELNVSAGHNRLEKSIEKNARTFRRVWNYALCFLSGTVLEVRHRYCDSSY